MQKNLKDKEETRKRLTRNRREGKEEKTKMSEKEGCKDKRKKWVEDCAKDDGANRKKTSEYKN